MCVCGHSQEEQHSLKRELAALAISMNMEAQKKRHMTVDTSQQAKRTTAREILVRPPACQFK